MKKILIEQVSNGFLVTVSKSAHSLLDEATEQYVAADIEEVLEIVKNNAD